MLRSSSTLSLRVCPMPRIISTRSTPEQKEQGRPVLPWPQQLVHDAYRISPCSQVQPPRENLAIPAEQLPATASPTSLVEHFSSWLTLIGFPPMTREGGRCFVRRSPRYASFGLTAGGRKGCYWTASELYFGTCSLSQPGWKSARSLSRAHVFVVHFTNELLARVMAQFLINFINNLI
jgi:hypothetical protein